MWRISQVSVNRWVTVCDVCGRLSLVLINELKYLVSLMLMISNQIGIIQKNHSEEFTLKSLTSLFVLKAHNGFESFWMPSGLVWSSAEVRCAVWSRQMDLQAAATRESPGLDPAGSLFRIEWVRVGWARAGGGSARSAALWSWSLGGFRTPPGVYGDERGSPSVLGRERRKKAVHRKTMSHFSKKKEDSATMWTSTLKYCCQKLS